ncbi:MAG TPA: PLP-dependent transferase [Acidobacteriota bacterium]|nr:PLP-dependent transferase [Acidobacteriota bacterium]
MTRRKNLKPETRIIEEGYQHKLAMNSAKPPLYLTSTFVFDSSEQGARFFDVTHGHGSPEDGGLIYSRIGNPNLSIFESRVRVFDGGEAAAAFSSGMSAISTMLMTLFDPDSYLAYAEPLYGGTEEFLAAIAPKLGIRSLPIRAGDHAAKALVELAEREGPPWMVFLETPANPSIEMTDIGDVAEAAHSMEEKGRRPLVAVDNTFLGPIFQQPLKHAADLVVYSCTKFIGGHSDFVGGALIGSEEHIKRVKGYRSKIGTTMDPFSAWLGCRSLETLDVRMRRSNETAKRIAAELDKHPSVLSVNYPELFPEGSTQRAIYEKQCTGSGALISFDLASKKAAFAFLDALEVFTLAVSLGGNESLAEHPAAHTHSGIPAEIRAKIGVGEGLARLSIGLEHPDDLLADIFQALEKI